MARQLRDRLTYANVMATLALFIALGGTSYGLATGAINSREIKNNAVRSKDIRNNAVQSKDVRDGSLQSMDFAPGQLPAGPDGAPGPQGPAGAEGPAGPPGADGATDIQVRTFSFALAANASGNDDVQCQPGERVVGGGATLGAATHGDAITSSGPAEADGSRAEPGDAVTGWAAGATKNQFVGDTVVISVLCASP